VTLLLKKTKPEWAARFLSALAGATQPWLAAASFLADEALDKGETLTYKFGKETDQEKDKPGTFAQYSGTDLAFLVSPEFVKSLREFDPRDKKLVFNFQPGFDAGLMNVAPLQPLAGLNLLSPLATNQVLNFDPAQVKGLKIAIRTPQELRNFFFERKDPKDKTWEKDPNLKEFTVDSEKLNKLMETMSKLTADRLVSFGGPKVDQKLTAKEATVQIEISFFDAKTKTITYTVGALFEGSHYFAHSDAWPEVVYFLNASQVIPFLNGAGYFGKERVAGGP
jgi:hypothetical protein